MKNKFLVSALVVASGLVGVDSMAQDSWKSRAQVRAELAMAQQDGSFPMYRGEEPVIYKYPSSSLSRAQVREELAAAQRSGTFPLYVGEELLADSDSPKAELARALAGSGEIDLPPTAAGPRTRHSVMNEFLRAQSEGRLLKQPDTGQ